ISEPVGNLWGFEMRRFFALFAVLAVVVAGCSSDDDDKSSETTTAQRAESTPTAAADDSEMTSTTPDGGDGTETTEVSGGRDSEIQATDFKAVENCDQLAAETVTAIKGIISTLDAIPMEEMANMTQQSLEAELEGVVNQDEMTAAKERLNCDDSEMSKKVCAEIVGIEAGNMVSQAVVAEFAGSCEAPGAPQGVESLQSQSSEKLCEAEGVSATLIVSAGQSCESVLDRAVALVPPSLALPKSPAAFMEVMTLCSAMQADVEVTYIIAESGKVADQLIDVICPGDRSNLVWAG
ncbi:MAG: hypothetical protein KAZ88_00505, partial [Acidimicrobiia bacterium]|nr:hypothetical protein [Acidimicrobiia bacterium]